MPKEVALDLVKIALFDVVILCDDSGSMAFEQNGERIDDLKLYVALGCLLRLLAEGELTQLNGGQDLEPGRIRVFVVRP